MNEPLCPVAQIKTGRLHNRLDFLVGLLMGNEDGN